MFAKRVWNPTVGKQTSHKDENGDQGHTGMSEEEI